jgi:dihydrofolate reductase
MSRVVFDISMSLDGFIAAANRRPDEPLGTGGEQLHQWASGQDERSSKLLEGALASLGAIITGKRNYVDSLPWWGADGPTGPARRPVFVLTHDVPNDVPENGVYTFVTGGITRVLEEAKATAAGKDVTIMGGANIGQQFIKAGLVDEISIHLVPVLFGSGTRMFDHLGDEHIQLETIDVIETPAATHLRFRVVT